MVPSWWERCSWPPVFSLFYRDCSACLGFPFPPIVFKCSAAFNCVDSSPSQSQAGPAGSRFLCPPHSCHGHCVKDREPPLHPPPTSSPCSDAVVGYLSQVMSVTLCDCSLASFSILKLDDALQSWLNLLVFNIMETQRHRVKNIHIK